MHECDNKDNSNNVITAATDTNIEFNQFFFYFVTAFRLTPASPFAGLLLLIRLDMVLTIRCATHN